MKIYNRFTGELIIKVDNVKTDLKGVDLSGANLRFARLSGADLRGANLRGADLSFAKLEGADLSYVDLSIANLGGANLRLADLSGANLREADLKFADLRGADLSGARLREADLRRADLTETKIDYQIQEGLLKQIAEQVLSNPDSLDMEDWHSECKTVHCIAGWACHLNPVAKELGKTHKAKIAGLLTLGAEAHSHFFNDNKTAIEWLKTKI